MGGFKEKPTIELQLYRNIVGGEKGAVGLPVELPSGTLTYTWSGQYETNDGGVNYVYSIEEVDTPAYHTKVEAGLQVTNTHSLGELEVNKTVTGNLGDKSKYFVVDVTFELPADKTMETNNSITYGGGKYSGPQTVDDNSQNTFTVTIEVKHGDTVTFSNIPYGVTCKVQEQVNSASGYDVDYDKENVLINSAKDTVTITNDKDVILDTGISLDSLPYILILLVVVIGGIWWMIRRRRNADF